jgi:CxxC motif-containing protein (DUF1111 family)
VVWTGGSVSREIFAHSSKRDRDALLAFLRSL